ncbi:RrF2 family transcriptional regulator [Zavarzinia aquatilis]|uniref:Rrf2 family transcriptional regulator n=1 Tax=Zavarzinia aquatilis TaxID=2211142 RepID=A0A317E1X6_9PROT|nr:Rrf2 family transcriptional regulator [Zavarzinia aquatilis]PWR20150.1 Rrf2 family transcriptional regulator [Zavarzinia aquatilis]
MISQKAKYAFKALLILAARSGETVAIEDVAADSGVPRKFLEHILLDLKGAGFIASRRGRAGGYIMARAADSVTIGAVLRVIDGPVAPLPCLSQHHYRPCDDCGDEAACGVRRLFARAYGAMVQVLDETTLADAGEGEALRALI